MIWSTPALKDSTIYEFDQYRNTGLDPILELYKQGDNSTNDLKESRIAIQFDLSDLQNILQSNSVSINDIQVNLKLYAVQEFELPNSYSIEAKALAHSWENGNGYKYYPASSGVSTLGSGINWSETNGLGSTEWVDVNLPGTAHVYTNTEGGGKWYTGSVASQSFSYKSSDFVNLNVTDIVKSWYLNEIENNGFLVTFKYSEISASNWPNTLIQFYSAETHTVYEPQLYVQWNSSSVYSTGSYDVATIDESPIVFVRSFKSEYQVDSKIRIWLGARPKSPRPSFSQNSVFSLLKSLPENSFYQIKDAHTDQILIPYSDFTKISTVEGMSYFDLYTTMLYPERFYKFEVKIDFEGVSEYYKNNEFFFKIVR